MQIDDFIKFYEKNDWVQKIAAVLSTHAPTHVHLTGTTGSLDRVLGAAIYKIAKVTQLFILHNKEEATHFYNDLTHLLKEEPILYYPAVDQQGDQIAHSQHTTIATRTEVLHQISTNPKPLAIVTYPEALTTRIVKKDTLASLTTELGTKETIVVADLITKLNKQGFEKTDFVYEVGQYAIRGGIIDIFSYANSYPFRITVWGSQIESIRIFDPIDQKSVKEVSQAPILPNSSTVTETSTQYQSLLAFLPPTTYVWLKDHAHTTAVIDQANQGNQQCQDKTESKKNWIQDITQHTVIEFGSQYHLPAQQVFEYHAIPQTPFEQKFSLLANDLQSYQDKGYQIIITAVSMGQFERIRTLLADQPNSTISFTPLLIGLYGGYVDHLLKVVCYTDHAIFERHYRSQLPKKFAKSKALTLKEFQSLQLGDYIVHTDYGIGRFSGLQTFTLQGNTQEAIRLLYKNHDIVYVNVHDLHKISKYTGKEGHIPTMSKLGTTTWENKKKVAKKKIQDIAKKLIQLYAKRKKSIGFAFSKDGALHASLLASFMYEDTPDQAAATAAVSKDMELPHPMDRLVCGDVGFGKTEIAIRATLKAAQDSKQVAILVPTTILALQHYNSFSTRLAQFGIKVNYINRFKTAKEVKKIITATTLGQVDVLIGTHKILSKQVTFKDLGLLIIDEEQKFGVTAKERLKEMRLHLDILTLTATPIPRTLHFSLMGARDLSIIATPPPNRQPIQTTLHTFDKQIIKEAIHYELQRGGQVFFVHNRVANIGTITHTVAQLFPTIRIGTAHGQMEGAHLEQIMLAFIAGDYDVLVATNIIESGLDIPNANTIIINNSHLFGLSDLHQMRGRVGRTNQLAFCYLLAPPTTTLTPDARRRLRALEEFSDLGDGFKIAMRDLDIRGAGDLLGAEQSGFIGDIGFNTYCQILEEGVQELKEGEFSSLFQEELTSKIGVAHCTLETDLAIGIPADYVSDVTERINFYTRLNNAKDLTALTALTDELKDRFGPLPMGAKALIASIQLRWQAQGLGLHKLQLKKGSMHCYMDHKVGKNAAQICQKLFAYVQKWPSRCYLKEVKQSLVIGIKEIHSIEAAQEVLVEIETFVKGT